MDSASPYLTTMEAAEYLRIGGPRAAKKRLLELGVKPFSFGPGRGRADLWRRSEIDAALDSQRSATKTTPPRKRRLPNPMDKPVSELMRELTGGRTTH